MNHFLGMNGWSHSLIAVKRMELKQITEACGSEVVRDCYEASFVARVQVCGLSIDGTANGYGHGRAVARLASEVLPQAQREAVNNALTDALARLVIVRLPNGKVVACVVQRDGTTSSAFHAQIVD